MTKKAFDFSTLDTAALCDKPFRLEFEHPVTKAPLACGVEVLGKDSAVFKAHVRSRANSRLQKQARRGKDNEAPSIEKIEAEAIDLLTACTTGIWGEILVDGQAITHSPENVRALYTRFSWAREQVDEAIGDLENFIKA
jgi:hypothetical protein